jgi:hypothetical protein
MHFFHDCGGSSELVRQHGQSSCTIVHFGSPRSAFLHLLPWMACMSILHRYMDVTNLSNPGAIAEEQKNSLRKNYYF